MQALKDMSEVRVVGCKRSKVIPESDPSKFALEALVSTVTTLVTFLCDNAGSDKIAVRDPYQLLCAHRLLSRCGETCIRSQSKHFSNLVWQMLASNGAIFKLIAVCNSALELVKLDLVHEVIQPCMSRRKEKCVLDQFVRPCSQLQFFGL